MSWLNNSLNTIKGQLTTLAQEVLAETAGPGDEDYRGPEVDNRTALELFSDTQKQNEELDKLCNVKDSEIALLRKQITELQNKISDSGGGNGATVTAATTSAAAGASGRTSKSPDNNVTILEDSWCWEPNDRSSETSSSGNGHEMVNITLEEVPLGATAKMAAKRAQCATTEQTSELQRRIQQLEDENTQLNMSLEELDSQHNLAMQNVLDLKTNLQEKLSTITKDYEALKREHADKFINGELELGKIKKQMELLQAEHQSAELEKQTMQKRIDNYTEELKKSMEELADLQMLLEKKTHDNIELIERVKLAGHVADKAEEERFELQQKIEALTKEVEEATKQAKEKKTSESSTSSTGKQSEDEFIVVREADANSSGPTTPPTKEELKDKIVQLENRVSELTLESGSLTLKLQDREMEKELSANVLKENLLALQNKNEEQEVELKSTKEQLKEEQEKVEGLKEKAAGAVILEGQLKALTEEKLKIETEISKMKESLKSMLELEKRLIFSEQEKEALQLELQGVRTTQERSSELEGKMQKLTLENQQLKLYAEAETETLNNSAELEDKLKSLAEENETLRAELEAIAQAKFRQAIAEEKQEITDLDADEEEAFNFGKLRELLQAYVKQDMGDGSDAGSLEKTYKALQEKLWKINTLEKNLVHLSEEILEMQDSKLVWDHEKKTLEADISQYVLQCDELMKNNEILLNELENYKRNKLETIHEHNEESILHLESQLEESTKLNRSLEQEYDELNKKNEELEREKLELTEHLRAAQEARESISATKNEFRLQLETLELEKCNLHFELNELKSSETKDTHANDALQQADKHSRSLESQLARLSTDHADLVAAMQSQKSALILANKKREETEKILREQEILVRSMDKDMQELRVRREEGVEIDRNLHELEELNMQLSRELLAKDIIADSLKDEINVLQQRLTEFDVLMQAKDTLEKELLENQQFLTNLQHDLHEKSTKEESLQAELKELLVAQEESARVDELAKLKQEKELMEQEYQELLQSYVSQAAEFKKLQDTPKATGGISANEADLLARIAKLEADLLATADSQKTLESLTYEKNEMIKALQQKHSENMQYYMEIQRLQPIVQQLQQQLAAAATDATTKPCEKCPTLQNTLAEMHKEMEKQKDQIQFLKEKSDILTTNLLTEQTNQKLMHQEKTDVEEQNAAIRKDIERLREHLLEIEEMHTQETMETQRELEETKSKMCAMQEEVSQSSNAYTSASIRANQHAETLQAQYALVVQQRDELVSKLSLAEDRESKNQAALCNLQCALEQFQNDKDNDIKAATQRIRKELQLELDKETQLQAEIVTLNQQLADANQGLRAASRLSEQLETCQQTIAALREEVETLRQHNNKLTEKLNSSESSQTDKIDKNLIKSLLIGYVVSGNPNDKNQVLRMISSVLDFSQIESDKVGLNKQQSGWLGSILGGSGGAQGAHSKDNLMQAFVEFLQEESQPKENQNNMPNLLNMTQGTVTTAVTTATTTTTAPASYRRTSVGSNSGSTPIPIQPLLLNSNVLNEFPPTRNSSSILKDILSDS